MRLGRKDFRGSRVELLILLVQQKGIYLVLGWEMKGPNVP
jgi:hypothetical protein